jgi:hypothetical protein
MSVETFARDDHAYFFWRLQHLDDGLVCDTVGSRIHRAPCKELNRLPPNVRRDNPFTTAYPKKCSTDEAELRAAFPGMDLPRCTRCFPG